MLIIKHLLAIKMLELEFDSLPSASWGRKERREGGRKGGKEKQQPNSVYPEFLEPGSGFQGRGRSLFQIQR